MTRKIIFLDIDGTLTLPGSNEPPASALEAVRRARENGHLVFLCTGRNRGMIGSLLDYPWDGYIASSGGYVVCGDEVIYNCPLTEEQRIRVLDTLLTHGIFRTVECLDGSYTDESFKAFLQNSAREGNSELLRWREQIEKSLNILPMKEYHDEPIYKVVVMIPDMDKMKQAEAQLGTDFQVVLQEGAVAGVVNGEIVNSLFNKGTAVEKVAAHYGMKLEDTIGIGDSMNDVEMIETVGCSICMENGAEKLKAMSDEVCPSVTDDGLWKAFERHGLL